MPKRTSPKAARDVVDAKDLEDVVHDKRADWRATGAKARRRQRRYKKLLLAHLTYEEDVREDEDVMEDWPYGDEPD